MMSRGRRSATKSPSFRFIGLTARIHVSELGLASSVSVPTVTAAMQWADHLIMLGLALRRNAWCRSRISFVQVTKMDDTPRTHPNRHWIRSSRRHEANEEDQKVNSGGLGYELRSKAPRRVKAPVRSSIGCITKTAPTGSG